MMFDKLKSFRHGQSQPQPDQPPSYVVQKYCPFQLKTISKDDPEAVVIYRVYGVLGSNGEQRMYHTILTPPDTHAVPDYESQKIKRSTAWKPCYITWEVQVVDGAGKNAMLFMEAEFLGETIGNWLVVKGNILGGKMKLRARMGRPLGSLFFELHLQAGGVLLFKAIEDWRWVVDEDERETVTIILPALFPS